ncbi:hypothetical protein IM816_08895 [Luteibacter flocculans]|uniref:Uncharacterized protein n=1 Tax=Luteibacter flocculans TaxID=2780091 RepID=A0ABY4TBA3_9GAMM|nr:hypothetical protein [Luteibacter flocculans]URL60174.1 hypothetical protein IM816_08895 [Luteibacter flocculans]
MFSPAVRAVGEITADVLAALDADVVIDEFDDLKAFAAKTVSATPIDVLIHVVTAALTTPAHTSHPARLSERVCTTMTSARWTIR